MTSIETLPVILVSAETELAANSIISELIGSEGSEEALSAGRVWNIVNKYYSADVRLLSRPDTPHQTDPASTDNVDCVAPVTSPSSRGADSEEIDAHVIYLAEHECVPSADVSVAERRRRAAGGAACGADDGDSVLLLLAAGAASAALRAWACQQHYEIVTLHEQESEESDTSESSLTFADERGFARARAALQARQWRGMRRRDLPARDGVADLARGGVDDPDELETEAALELAAALAEAARGARAGGVPDAERRARAEALLRAFCGAIGTDLDDL